jgi:O-glycosyl hydrolase
MGSALWMAEKIITDINDLKPSAWVMWQVINSFISKDGFNGNPDSGMVDVNKGFWGATVADCDKEEIILTQKYYAIGQFSKFIRPGSTLIVTGEDTSLAAYDKNAGTLTIVAVNDKKEDKSFAFDIKGFDTNGNVKVIRTSGSIANGEHWDEVDNFMLDNNGIIYTLPAFSITTFVIEGVSLEQ